MTTPASFSMVVGRLTRIMAVEEAAAADADPGEAWSCEAALRAGGGGGVTPWLPEAILQLKLEQGHVWSLT